MNKKALTEADIRTKFITPAIIGENVKKWDVMTQLLEEHYFTKGRVIVQGKTVRRGEAKKADYILFYKPNVPMAVVEAKDNNQTVGAGMQQALEYAEILDVPFAYSSNGDAFLEHDRTATNGVVEREIPLDQFPSPDELWARYSTAKGYNATQQTVTTQDYYFDGSGKSPRYYQLVAINRTVDAIARGEKPIRIEEFEPERAWWGDESNGFAGRVENEQAWRVSIDQIKAGNYNLDLKNPHVSDTGPGDVDHLLPEYEKLLAQIAATRAELKAQLQEALSR